MKTYFVFLRSARNFEEFARAPRYPIGRGWTLAQARDYCQAWNRARSPERRQGPAWPGAAVSAPCRALVSGPSDSH